MPLIVICGQPSSGKSTVVAQLAESLRQQGATVEVVDEPSLHLERNSSYEVLVNEKNTRAKLKSTIERGISKKTTTIVDSLNNIKGYRYEIWCIARATGTRYCMVHVDTPVETCRQWNQARTERGEPSYRAEIFEDLARRFERPDSRQRWDAPLFTVQPAGDADEAAAAVQTVVQAMTQTQAQAQAAQAGGMQAQYASDAPVQMIAKELVPTMATNNPTMLGTNVLHDIDQATQDVVDKIVEAQSASAGGAAEVVTFGPGLTTLQLKTIVSLAELRRHKRGFMKLATKVTFARLQDGVTAKRLFIDYLRDQLQ